MKRAALGVILVIWGFNLFYMPTFSQAAIPDLLIVEIQTTSKTSASQELIRIANTTSKTISLVGMRVEYFSADPKSISIPSRTFNLTGSLAAGQSYLLASKDYLTDKANLHYSATLAGAGGHLRLSSGVVTNPRIYDFVGYGTAKHPRGNAAPAPEAGEILKRKKTLSGQYIYTDNNRSDFELPPKPVAPSKPATPIQAPTAKLLPKATATKPSLAVSSTYFKGIMISELMPNPAKPQLDSKHEYIELHNSSSRAVNLAGLTIIAGPKLNKKFTIKSGAIGAGKYKAFSIAVTRLTLSNAGGRAELRSPDGKTIGRTVVYDKAKDGMSYSWDGGGWQWSNVATPNAKNVISGAADGKQPTESSDVDLGQFGMTDTGQVKSATTTKKAKDKAESRPINSKIIAGVGSLGLIYGLYEYRTDIANLFSRLRGNRGSREKAR